MRDLLEHPVVAYLLERGGWVAETDDNSRYDFKHIGAAGHYVFRNEMRTLLRIPVEQIPLVMATGRIVGVRIPSQVYFERDIVPILAARLLLELPEEIDP